MKRMKKIIGCLVGVLLTAETWAGGTLTLGSHVFTQGDSTPTRHPIIFFILFIQPL